MIRVPHAATAQSSMPTTRRASSRRGQGSSRFIQAQHGVTAARRHREVGHKTRRPPRRRARGTAELLACESKPARASGSDATCRSSGKASCEGATCGQSCDGGSRSAEPEGRDERAAPCSANRPGSDRKRLWTAELCVPQDGQRPPSHRTWAWITSRSELRVIRSMLAAGKRKTGSHPPFNQLGFPLSSALSHAKRGWAAAGSVDTILS